MNQFIQLRYLLSIQHMQNTVRPWRDTEVTKIWNLHQCVNNQSEGNNMLFYKKSIMLRVNQLYDYYMSKDKC